MQVLSLLSQAAETIEHPSCSFGGKLNVVGGSFTRGSGCPGWKFEEAAAGQPDDLHAAMKATRAKRLSRIDHRDQGGR